MTPVQMMISSRSGLIRWTVLRETISREALPRPFFDAPWRCRGRISPSALDWNRSTKVAVVFEARAEQMCEESVRAATKRCGHLHCTVLRWVHSCLRRGGPTGHPSAAPSRPSSDSSRCAALAGGPAASCRLDRPLPRVAYRKGWASRRDGLALNAVGGNSSAGMPGGETRPRLALLAGASKRPL